MSGDSECQALKTIKALRAETGRRRLDPLARFDQLKGTSRQNHDALMRQVQLYGR
jgi:hypothetical protein